MRHGSESGPRVCPKRSRVTKRQSPRPSATARARSWPKRCGGSRCSGATAPRSLRRPRCASGATRWRGRRATTCWRRKHSTPSGACTSRPAHRTTRVGCFSRPSSSADRAARCARVWSRISASSRTSGASSTKPSRYEQSLDAYRDCGDDHGCALAYHNLGMVSADRGWLNAADCYFRESRALAERVGDVYLRGLCLVNHAELDVTRQRFEDARQKAEEALAVFDQLGVKSAKAEAYRVIGMVYRETGRIVLAESRLRSAIELAVAAGAVLGEAEASRELALLYQAMGRNQE